MSSLSDPVYASPVVDNGQRLEGERTWWTVADLAEELQVNEKTIRRWITDGKLTAKRAGKGLRIHRYAVAAFLERDPVGPQPLKRRRGGQLKHLPPPWIRQMREEREVRQQEVRDARAQRGKGRQSSTTPLTSRKQG